MQVEYIVNPMYLEILCIIIITIIIIAIIIIIAFIILGLIEVLRYFPGFDGLNRAKDDQYHVVHLE